MEQTFKKHRVQYLRYYLFFVKNTEVIILNATHSVSDALKNGATTKGPFNRGEAKLVGAFEKAT